LTVERREQKLERLTKRTAFLEGGLKREGQHRTISLKEVITLKQQLAKTG
jgi:hypothetical protein